MKKYIDATIIQSSPPGALPLEIAVKAPMLRGFGRSILPIVLGGAAVLFTLHAVGGLSQREPIVVVLAALVPLLALAWAVFLGPGAARSGVYRIDGDRVQSYAKGVDAGVTWSEPLANYTGVRWERFAEMRSGNNSSTRSRTYHHVMTLAHPDASRTVPLLRYSSENKLSQVLPLLIRSKLTRNPTEAQRTAMQDEADRLARKLSDADLRAQWEGFARLLGVQAIDARDGAEMVRASADLDAPIQVLAAEGRLESDTDLGDPPPSLDVVRLGSIEDPASQTLRVTIRRAPMRWFNLLLIAVGLVLMVFGAVAGAGAGMFVAGVVFAGAGAGIWYLQRRFPRRLEITRQEITHVDPAVNPDNFTIPLKSIETIHLRKIQSERVTGLSAGPGGKELVISTDAGERTIGAGLPTDALEWLRRYLVAAIADA